MLQSTLHGGRKLAGNCRILLSLQGKLAPLAAEGDEQRFTSYALQLTDVHAEVSFQTFGEKATAFVFCNY
jgi:hypothetical protein